MSETSDTDEQNGSVGEMSIVDHLQEFRRRLIICLIAVGITSTGCYFYAADLVHVITAPAGKIYFMNPAEAFFAYLQISLFAGLLLALPVVLYEVWAFVIPALTTRERTAAVILVPASVFLFFLGLTFSYFLVLPAGIKFFMSFATDTLQPMISLGQYLSFVISFLLPFGCIFELPLFVVVLAKLGMIGSAFLKSKRKVILVLSFVVGAVISPTPDVFSQTMVAVPIILLYEVSLLIVKYVLRK
ncbi:MAG: twin-arginine translocase subunit TatC [Pelosinus sp.]|nr:twin-arginine translocase subunit TatC [Pelosinus sp.]